MKPKKGDLLISSPELLLDHIFNQSVVLLTEHHREGSLGFMINKPLPVSLNDILPDMPSGIQLWNGGPVETNNLFYIHEIPNLLKGSTPIDLGENLYMGGDFEILKSLLVDKKIEKSQIKFFIGYSGWSKEQLEMEIFEKAWFVQKNNLNIFSINPKNIWKQKIVEVNPENAIWKNAPLNPNLN